MSCNSPPLVTGRIDLGTWIDDPPSVALAPKNVDALRALPFSHLAVMLDGPEPGLAVRWRPADLAKLARAFPNHERVLTVWAQPTMACLRELVATLPSYLDALESTTIDLDMEPVGGWKRGHVQGFRSLEEAGECIVTALRAHADEVEVDTFPSALPNLAGFARHANRIVLQCYTTTRKGEATYEGPLGPRRYPHESILAASKRIPGVEIVAGLACYGQSFEGVEPRESMRVAFDAARITGVRRVRYWSAKHAIRTSARRYAGPAIESLRSIAVQR